MADAVLAQNVCDRHARIPSFKIATICGSLNFDDFIRLSSDRKVYWLLSQFRGSLRLRSHRLDARLTTAPPHPVRKALRVVRVVLQERQALALHGLTVPPLHPALLKLTVDARIAAGQIAYPSNLAVIPP
jgi:hypothetical protein